MPDEHAGPEEVISRDPFTGILAERFPAAGAAGVVEAVKRAQAAQPEWNARTPHERTRIIDRFRVLSFERRLEIAALISRETSKAPAEAMAAEVVPTLDLARFYAREAPAFLAPRASRSGTLALWRKRITTTMEPLGVVGVISPWNYPFMLPAGVLLPALVAGNAVILKPSELTPACGALLVDLLHEAGVPNDVVQVLQGAGFTGAALVESGVDKIGFTGSVATGRRVAEACARRLTPCSLELGGSDPALVLDDADLEVAARGIAWGRFANAGQTCVAPKRVFVAAAVFEPFVSLLERQLNALRLRGSAGDASWDVGPLIRPTARDQLERQRDDATAAGARALVRQDAPTGVMPPTIVLDPASGAFLMKEETFGPLLPIVSVRDDDDAIARANDTTFGLSASVWSRSRGRARQVASRLMAGTVAINDVTLVAGMAEVAHGGVKASGWGRSHGLAGLGEYVRTRVVVDDVFTSRPQPWWFPYGNGKLEDFEGYARLAHGRTISERLSGIGASLRLLLRR